MADINEDLRALMIRRLKFLLLAAIVLALFGLLYKLKSAPNPSHQTLLVSGPTITLKPSSTLTDSDFARHVAELRRKLPSALPGAIIPILIGDESEALVKAHSENTVKWAVGKLKQDYFAKDPKEILDIWLFKDAASYERNALALFGEKPTTPYGYYSSAHKALIMNISTGGGTLVHEIVHPFVEANFPDCPPWFNEGLGSLYEQSGEVNGHIHGYTNWRLPGLQAAIKAGNVRSFKDLMSLDSRAFYNDDKGTNYGQSRYLCYYLQQRGLLVKFYREFVNQRKDDKSGYKTLMRVLAVRDMTAFKRTWEKFVLGLQQGYDVTVR